MKTIRLHFEDFKNPYKRKALSNIVCENILYEVKSKSLALECGFVWGDSIEGHKYWQKYWEKLKNDEIKKELFDGQK